MAANEGPGDVQIEAFHSHLLSLPLTVAVCDAAPTVGADGQLLSLVYDVYLYVSVSAVVLPRILTLFYGSRHIDSSRGGLRLSSFKAVDEATICGPERGG
jgi:hypothetical protein